MIKKEHKQYIYLFIAVAFIAITPWLFAKNYSCIVFNQDTGAIGDTIGGITAPFVNLLAAFLVWISFKEQVKANKLLSTETSYNYLKTITQDFNQEINLFNKVYNEDLKQARLSHFNNQNYDEKIFKSQYKFIIKIFSDYVNLINTLEFITNEISNNATINKNLKESIYYKISQNSKGILQHEHILYNIISYNKVNDVTKIADYNIIEGLAIFGGGFIDYNNSIEEFKNLQIRIYNYKINNKLSSLTDIKIHL